jgi:hypothetical protein
MTKKLEELLNLPDSQEIIKAEQQKSNEVVKSSPQEDFRTISELDKITAALPAVKGLGELADQELNDIAMKATSAYDDLMDLGMNVEARYSGRVFEVAGGMLKTALDAKVAKLDKKLKMIDLQLKKEKMDKDSGYEDSGLVNGEGYVVVCLKN